MHAEIWLLFADVGSRYQVKSIVVKGQQHEKPRPHRSQTATSRTAVSYDIFNNETQTNSSVKRPDYYDQLTITDLTNNEDTEQASPCLETKGLLR